MHALAPAAVTADAFACSGSGSDLLAKVDAPAALNHPPAGEHSSFGVRPFEFTYLTAGLLASAPLVFIVASHLTGDWHASHLHAA